MDRITFAILFASAVCIMLGIAAGYSIGYGHGVKDAFRSRTDR